MTASLYQSSLLGRAKPSLAEPLLPALASPATVAVGPPLTAVRASVLLASAPATDRPAVATTSPPLDLAARRAGSGAPLEGTFLPSPSAPSFRTRRTFGCFIARARRCARRRARDARSCAGRASGSERHRAGRARRRRDPGPGRAPRGRGRAIPTPSEGARVTPRTGPRRRRRACCTR